MKTLTRTIIALAIIMQSFNMSAESHTIIDFFDYGAFKINISLELKITNYNKICDKIGGNWYNEYIYSIVHTVYDSLDLYEITEYNLINGLTDIIVSESFKLGFKIKDYHMTLGIDSESEIEYDDKDERNEAIAFAAVTTTLIGVIIILVSAMSSN